MSTFWPTFTKDSVTPTPATVLREAAAELGKQFNNKIVGEVRSEQSNDRQTMINDLYVSCPPLNYRFRALKLSYKFLEPYPAQIHPDAEIGSELGLERDSGIVVNDEAEFVTQLQRVLGSKKVAKVVTALRQHLNL